MLAEWRVGMQGDALVVTLDIKEAIVQRFSRLESMMSDLTNAVSNFKQAFATSIEGVKTDVDHLRALLDQALATPPDAQAEIDRLKAEADSAVNSINEATASVQGLDVDPSFPAAPTGGDTGDSTPPAGDTGTDTGATTPPADTGSGTGTDGNGGFNDQNP